MGYMSLISPCVGCGKVFSSNPNSVPSYRNEPICRECITVVNEYRKSHDLPLWPVLPDAYEAVEVD